MSNPDGAEVHDRLRSAVAAGDGACFATENIATLLSIKLI
jgi:hypothetical protein